MLSLANQFVARVTRLVLAADGRIIGSLVRQNGAWRLSWFNGADYRPEPCS